MEWHNPLRDLSRFLKSTKWAENSGEIYMVLVAVDSYVIEEDVNFAISDCEEIFDIWSEYSKHHLKSKNVYKHYNDKATKIGIIQTMTQLSDSLRPQDQLIIQFSGHQFADFGVNFWIPSEGSRENHYSCLSSSLIDMLISRVKCSSIMLIFDTTDDGQVGGSQPFENSSQVGLSSLDTREKVAYGKLINFLNARANNQRKEIYWFERDPTSPPDRNKDGNTTRIMMEANLRKKWQLDRARILGFVKNGRLDFALKECLEIVKGNDGRFLEEIVTLSCKLKSLKARSQSTLEIEEARGQIAEITRGVVNEIDKNGFYTVALPSDLDTYLRPPRRRSIILFVSADPIDQDTLRFSDEYRAIHYELIRSKNRDEFELVPCLAARIGDFQRQLLDLKPQIVHFSGHGKANGICLLGEDQTSASKVVDNRPLADLFSLFSKFVTCIFLNSCHSIGQSDLLKKHIQNVICMSNEIPDATAIHFAVAFYAALASGYDIEFSFNFAKNSIDLHNFPGVHVPVLLQME